MASEESNKTKQMIKRDTSQETFNQIKKTKKKKTSKPEPKAYSKATKTSDEKKDFSYLETYCENMTEKIAKKVENFRVYGREKEVEEVQIFLKRSIKNCPLLVGDAGVGKTAIVDGLAAGIIKGEVDPIFDNNTIWSLEMANISSETNGEGLLAKLNGIVQELKEKKSEYILFVDELHTIIGSGKNGKGGNDAGQSLKAALARGEIRMIGATTLDEYQQYIEPDKALERRVQLIMVEEPTVEQTRLILNGVKKRFEKDQKVTITEEAVDMAISLSTRYIPERYLPDKALDLLDEASATVNFAGRDTVTEVDIARVIERLKRIPLRSLIIDESLPFVDYETQLKKYVKGQDIAVKQVAEVLYAFDEGLKPVNKPIGSFLFLGTTGVGKTELAKALARVIFGSEKSMIRIDCSEYQDPGDVKKLIGDNNYESQGILTSKVKNNPYSVVLLDEFEKADSGFYDAFLQVFDDGRLTTGVGRTVDFTNTIVIVTTNAGHEEIKKTYRTKGSFSLFGQRDWELFYENIDDELEFTFRPELLNRFSAKIVFDMLTDEVVHLIAENSLKKVIKRLASSKVTIKFDENIFMDYLISKGANVQMGARPMERLLEHEVINAIAKELAKYKRHGKPADVNINVNGKKPDGIRTMIDKRYLTYDITING